MQSAHSVQTTGPSVSPPLISSYHASSLLKTQNTTKIDAVRDSIPSQQLSPDLPHHPCSAVHHSEEAHSGAQQEIVFPSTEWLDWEELVGEWCVQQAGSQLFIRMRDGRSFSCNEQELDRLARLLAVYERTEGDPATTIFFLKRPNGKSLDLKVASLVTYSDLVQQEESSPHPLTRLGSCFGGMCKLGMFLCAAGVSGVAGHHLLGTRIGTPPSSDALVPADVSFEGICPAGNFTPYEPYFRPFSREVLARKALQQNPKYAEAIAKKNCIWLENLFGKEVSNDNVDMVTLFIEANVGIDIKKRRELLCWAISMGSSRLVELLLQNGVDPNKVPCFGRTPFFEAVTRDDFDPTIIELLRNYGADVNLRGLGKQTTALTWAVEKRKTEVVKLLLQLGANPSTEDGFGDIPLTLAADHSSLEIAELLIQYGANVNPQGLQGRAAPLAIAILKKNTPLALFLLRHGANPNAIAYDASFPIDISERLNLPEITEALIAHGADTRLALRTTLMNCAAHSWTIGGSALVGTSFGNYRFNLEGQANHVISFRFADICSRFLHLAEQSPFPIAGFSLSKEERTIVQEAVQQMISVDERYSSPSYEKSLQQIMSGRPLLVLKTVFLFGGAHGIGVVFHKNRMMICDRGALDSTGIRIFDLPTTDQVKSALRTILETTDYNYILARFPEHEEVEFIPQKHQKVGNCGWTSAESGLLALIYSVLREESSNKTALARARLIYKSFTTFARIQSLEDYLAACNEASQLPNVELMEKIRDKIAKSPQRFDQWTQGRLLGMLKRQGYQNISVLFPKS